MPHVRCSRNKCQTRRTLKKLPHEYVIVPKCRGCGGRKYRVDKYRRDVERQRKACTCPFYHYPHRLASGFCIHNRNVTEEYERDRGRLPQPIPQAEAVEA